jgi:hypothetical protein
VNFVNLSLGELLGLLGGISAGIVALYMLDRSKRKQVVSTLRFWTNADVRTELKHRRKIQQPWSLILQLVSLALLLLAIAGPRFGLIDGNGLDHVVILDTSSWMGATQGPAQRQGTQTQATLMDQARAAARAYVRSLPARDRVMILRADTLATPATAFELNREIIDAAIQQSQPGAAALSLEPALAFAQRVQKMQGQKPGEIVLIGAGRVHEPEAALASVPANLRVINVPANPENVGLRKIGMRRNAKSPDVWDIFVAVRNYSPRPQTVDLALSYARSPAGAKRLTLKPNSEEQAEFSYRERAGGWLEARIQPANGLASRDAFPGDDRALVEVTQQTALKVVVYSANPQPLRPLFGSNSQVETTFEAPDKYDPAVKADLVVLDAFAPKAMPQTNSMWIQPPQDGSPVPIRTRKPSAKLTRWHPENPLGEGLRTSDATLENVQVLVPGPGDIRVAETDDGVVMLGRAGEHKMVILGFNPGAGAMKYELATPLLVANIMRWITPGAFRRWEMQAAGTGTITVPVGKDVDAAHAKVLDQNGQSLPFTLEDGVLRFFAGASGSVRVQLEDREMVYSLTLPDLAETAWQIPPTVKKGVPRGTGGGALPTDIWPWLALLGGLGLLADWLLFGRTRAIRLRSGKTATPVASKLPFAFEKRKAS